MLVWARFRARQTIAEKFISGRKVRTPHGNVAGNARPPQGEDQCNRKDVRKRQRFALVKSGKLYVVQVQIGRRFKGGHSKSAGRALEPRSNSWPRRMMVETQDPAYD